MKNKLIVVVLSVSFFVACENTAPQNQECSSVISESSGVAETKISNQVESEKSLTWSSMEEAIAFYENTLIQDLGEDLASISLDGEFYERDSWELIENSGDTIILTLKNVGFGGRNVVEFVKEGEYTTLTFFEVDTPYPENPISRRKVRNSDMVTVSQEDLRPVESGEDLLTGYSAQEIEYARAWLEVMGNKDVEELNVSFIAQGEPINAYEAEDSATYPEDVVVLSGKIMADGMVVYSSNGDGTINLYAVPSHWQQGVVPEGQTMLEYTATIANKPTVVPITVGDDQEVATLIERERISQDADVASFTEEDAFALLKEQEDFNEDLALEYATYHADENYYELVIVSKSLQSQGGSGTVGIYHVYEDGTIVDTYAD